MRSWFQNLAGRARYATTTVSSDIAPLPTDTRLAAAHILNYDVLSIIFTLASTNWSEAALTLSAVCSLWRYVAISTPQIWSRINLGTSISPSSLRMILEYSKPLPLHIVIPSSASKKQLKVISLATNRIACMRIIDHFGFLLNQFPILERLRLDHTQWAQADGLRCLSEASRFPKLREISMPMNAPPEIYQMAWFPKFAGLQQLEISSWVTTHGPEIIQGLSNTLVSLVLHVRNINHIQLSFLPRLRHLRVIKYTGNKTPATLHLDAPYLESIHHVSLGNDWGDWAFWDTLRIRLQNPGTVKQLRVMAQEFDASPYPELQMLWVDSHRYSNDRMVQSLEYQIASRPKLKTILYCDSRGEATAEEHQHSHLIEVFPAILNVVQATGRDIAVREILPNELDLPGDMRRSKECLRWSCHE